MKYFYVLLAICAVIIFLFIYTRFLKKKLNIRLEHQLELYKKELINDRKGEIAASAQEAIFELTQKRARLDKEIREKSEFNESLKKIREEELDRLIEQERIEKRKTLDQSLSLYRTEEQLKIDNAFKEAKIAIDKTVIALKEEAEGVRINYEEEKKILDETKLQYLQEIEDFRLLHEAINEAILREKEISEQKDFYRICISESDQADIEVLKSIAGRLVNREAIYKLIYDVFVKRPLDEMIKRVVGTKEGGIYKVTYIKTGEAYIGRTTNFSNRWRAHCKTICGLEGAARTTFHNRVANDGLWNYTFEVLEEVPKEKQNEREKFYIELYQTDKQLNSKKGG